MSAKLKETINLILTVILSICAIVITGLFAINTFMNFGTKTQPIKILNGSQKLPSYRLPLAMQVSGFEDLKNKTIRGFPLAAEFATIISIAKQEMIFLPILMNEPQIVEKLNFRIVDPMKFDKTDQFSEHVIGRRSLWYMPIGATMLYGFLIDPQWDNKNIGSGYVLVKRITEDAYDIILKDNKGMVLYAARGILKKINEEIGQGTLVPLADQQMVKDIYQPRWDMEPKDFILFCYTCDETINQSN